MKGLLGWTGAQRIIVLVTILALLSMCFAGIAIIPRVSKRLNINLAKQRILARPPVEAPITTIGNNLSLNPDGESIKSPSILRIDPTHRFLIGGDGKPVLLVGDSAWSAVAQLTTSEMDSYLQDRANRGFNLVLVNLIEHHYSSYAPENIYGDAPFTGANFTTPNEAYFSVADHFIQKADSLGIYVLLDILYLGYYGSEDGWDTEVTAASTADMQFWGNWLGNRYKNYPNIIWVLGGDQNPSKYMTKLTACANALLAADPNHLVTVHNGPDPVTAVDFTGEPSWLVLNNIYGKWSDDAGLAAKAYAHSPTMPFFMIEGYYEDDRATEQQARMQNYTTILGGGGGFVFGNSPIWKFAFDGGNWEAALGSPGARDTIYAKNFFQTIGWNSLVPDSRHDVLSSGYGTLGSDDYAAVGAAADGSLAAIYMPSNRTMSVNMSYFNGTVTVKWYDPTNGSYFTDKASPLVNSGTHDFSRSSVNSEGDHDWVLVLETQNKTPPPTLDHKVYLPGVLSTKR